MQQRILRIKLVSPRMSLRPMDSEFKRRMAPSLSLVTLASLTPEPHLVCIEDENLKPVNYHDRPDLVGITVNVDTTYRAFEISGKFREQGIRVVFGGIHASADPGAMLEHCDAVCIGEAEEIWPVILDDHLAGRLQRIYFNPVPTDLARVPLPDWNYISKKDYLYHNVVVTGRGCPHRCDFCYNSCDYVTHSFRNRPIQQVLEEIRNLGTRHVMFIDDNLIGNIEWTEMFVEKMAPMKLTWHGAVSANIVRHPALIKKMGEAGCRSLFIGFESIHAASIHSVNKGQNRIHEYEDLIGMLHENNIMVNASLVFGFDHDTVDTFPATLNWLVRNRVETMTGHILTPYPGTRLYKKLISENRIFDHDYSHYNTSNVVFQPRNMSPEQLRNGYLEMYRDFYSLGNILRRKPLNRQLVLPYFMFNLGYRKYGRTLSLLGKIGLMNRIGRMGRKLAYGIE
jgi:radical SAM superfamily enzyme YgiQ (UPF0313 family)